MQIIIKAKLYAPISYGGPRAPLLWKKEFVLQLTPKILWALLDGEITLDEKLCFDLGNDDGYNKHKNVLTLSKNIGSKEYSEEYINFLKRNNWIPREKAK